MTQQETALLSPESLAKIANLELIARLVVEGFITGLHKSPYHGFSVEFAEHRQYMPGDAIRTIDWKVYGRTSRLYVKRFEEETNLKAYILLDTSASMNFGSGAVTKLRYGSMLAASLAYLMTRQNDASGLVLFDSVIRQYLPPRAAHSYLKTIHRTLAGVEPGRHTAVAPTLHEVAERIKRRGLVILISDLLDDPATVLSGLQHFRHDGHEIIVFHILDPAERDLSYDGDVIFEDLETGERLGTQPWHIRKEYQKEVSGFVEQYRAGCRARNIDFVTMDTTASLDHALLDYMTKRARTGG